jgi:phage terminase large subunit-like protein
MLRSFLRLRLDEEGLYVAGLETKFNPRTEKSARLDTLQPFFATGKIYIKEGQVELEDELNIYPRGKHDDLLDGLYYATRKLYIPDHTTKNEEDDLRYFLRGKQTNNNWMRQ